MEALLSSVAAHPKLPAASKPTAFVSVLDQNEENFFEGILAGNDGMQNSSNIISQLLSSNTKPHIFIPPSVSTSYTLAAKRLLPSQYWNEAPAAAAAATGSSMGASSGNKRFHGDLNSCSTATDQDNTSFVSLLSQLPQSTPLKKQKEIKNDQVIKKDLEHILGSSHGSNL